MARGGREVWAYSLREGVRGLRDLGVRRFAALTGVLISFAVIGALLDVAIFLTGLAIMVVAAVMTTVFVWPQIKQLSRPPERRVLRRPALWLRHEASTRSIASTNSTCAPPPRLSGPDLASA